MRSRQSASRSKNDISRRVKKAARNSGQSVHEWLDDLVAESESAHDFPDFVDGRHDTSSAEEYYELQDRIEALEATMTAPRRNPSRGQAAYRTPYQYEADSKAERLVNMLDTVNFLEKKLNTTRQSPSHSTFDDHSDRETLDADPSNAARMTRLERKLGRIEQHLDGAVRKLSAHAPAQQPAVPMHYAPQPATPQQTFRPKRRTGSYRDAIANLQPAAGAQSFQPKNASTHEENAQQFEELIAKIDSLKSGSINANSIAALQNELASLKQTILHDSANNLEAGLNNIRSTIADISTGPSHTTDPKKLDAIEADVNRIAEFLLKSPDLTHVPDKMDAVSREVSRVSDGLLAAMGKTESAARETSAAVIRDVNDNLVNLKGEIVHQINDVLQTVDGQKNASLDIEQRLFDLSSKLDKNTSEMRGFVEQMETSVSNLADAGSGKATDINAAQIASLEQKLIAAIENNPVKLPQMDDSLTRLAGHIDSKTEMLKKQMSALESKIGAAATKGADVSAGGTFDIKGHLERLQSHIDDNTATLRKQVSSLEERLSKAPGSATKAVGNAATTDFDEPLKRIQSHMDENTAILREHMSVLESRVMSATGHLPTADGSAAIDYTSQFARLEGQIAEMGGQVQTAAERLEKLGSARYGDDATEKFSEMEGRLVKAAERLESASLNAAKNDSELGAAALSLPDNLVTADQLESGLNQLADRVGSDQISLYEKIDTALGTLSTLSKTPANSTDFEAAFDAFKKEQSAWIENAKSGDGVSNSIYDELDQLKHMSDRMSDETKTLSSETKDAFGSVMSILNRVSDRLDKLEGPVSIPNAAGPSFGQNPAPADFVEPDDPAVLLTEAMKTSSDLKDAPAFKSRGEASELSPAEGSSFASGNTEDKLIERMRAHVKAREPDAPLIQATLDDEPLEPGTDSPTDDVFTREAKSSSDFVDYSESTEIVQPADNASIEEVRFDDVPKSKADFIAAARKAAQIAASEQESMKVAEDVSEEKSKRFSLLKSFRNKFTKSAQNDLPEETPEKVEVQLEDDLPQTYDFNGSDEIDPDHLPASFEDDFSRENLIPGEEPKQGRRTWLTVALVIAILAGVAYLQKQTIGTLIASLSDSPAVSTSETPQTIAPATDTGPANSATPAAPPTIDGDLTDDLVPAEELPVPLDDTAADTSEPLADTLQDEALLTENGIDPSVIQSISPATITEPSAIQPAGRSIFTALSSLPQGATSEKLSNGLLEEDPLAFLELARRFTEGDHVEQDLAEAAYWYEQAARKGSAIAQYRLATLYQDGIGVSRDFDESHKWYKRAAENGNARAMHNLAVLNAEGALGQSDFKTAYRWFKQGADFGVPDSQFNLAILYVRGLGTEVNLIEAYKWFDISARGGDRDAASKRDDIAKALGADKLEAAKAIAASWEKKPWINEANVLTRSALSWEDQDTRKSAISGKDLVRKAQSLLNELGYEAGTADGVVGSNTDRAVRAFQIEIGEPVNGIISNRLIDQLEKQRL